MVSSVQPTAHTPITPLQQQQVRTQQTGVENGAAGDAVTLSRAAGANGQGTLDVARGVLDLALAAGREAANVLSQMRDVARAAADTDDAGRAELDTQFQTLAARYNQIVDGAIKAGADLLAGVSMDVALDDGGASVTISGYDLRLKDNPGLEDVLRLSSSAALTDEAAARGVARDADASLARLDVALSRLSGAAQKLSAHDSFLSALDSAVAANVNEPADAEGARLLALQVRQGLLGSNSAIANAAPQALLSLFRE